MQAESVLLLRSRFAAVVLCAGGLLAGVSGCHRTPSADVVATVNGKDILRADLEKYYKYNLGDNPQPPSADQADIVRLNILKQMIEDEIVQQSAAKLNLVASDEDVNAKLTEMKAPYTQEEFDKLLAQRGLTVDDLKRNFLRSLTQEKLLNKEIESKINITDAQISDYYTAHKADFNQIEPQYHLAAIIVYAGPSPQTGGLQSNKVASDADAKKKIQALYNRLDSGDDFGAVAMQFSEDANTSSNGGDGGFVAESQLQANPDTFTAISQLKPGQFTGVLPLVDGATHKSMGYAIYKLIGREPAGQRELSDPRVKQAVHQLLHEGQAQLLKSAYFEKLNDDAKVHNYLADEILKSGAQ